MRVLWFGISVLIGAVLVHADEFSTHCPRTYSKALKYLDNQTLLICCGGSYLESMLDKAAEEFINTSPYEVLLGNCKAPDDSIAAVLKEHNITLPRILRVKGTSLDGMLEKYLQPRIFSELNNLLHLSLINTPIQPGLFDFIRVSDGLIETFYNLKTLHLRGLKLPSNFNSSISELTLENVYIDQKIHCRNLRVLTLRSVRINNEFTKRLSKWLVNCTALENLTIENVQEYVVHMFLQGANKGAFKFLTINHSGFMNQIWIGNLELDWYKLERLDLSWNEIPYLEIEHAELYYEEVLVQIFEFRKLKFLKELSFAHNKLSSFCSSRCISLSSTVTLLNLSYNLFTEVKFRDFIYAGYGILGSHNIEIDLRGNMVELIHFEEEEYNYLAKQRLNMTLLIDSPINCECNHAVLARALREFPSFVVTARCSEVNTSLELAPQEMLECTKSSCYPGCSCTTQWRGNITELRCEGLTSIPHNVSNMHALKASNNQISELRTEDIPDSLLVLDLSYNKLSRIDPGVVKTLFSVPQRMVSLAGNPLMCDCYNKPLLKALHDHKKQVLDYEQISCYSHTTSLKPLKEMSLDGLCVGDMEADNTFTLALVLSVIFALLTILVIFVALYYRYKRSIKQYLYLRGCCLFCIAEEEENDSEMIFDVFLSYSHKDEELILQELLPGLEDNATHPYKVCIHSRDWIGGEYIPKQIVQSVVQSRRTLIVLSENFAQSFWGLLEFRSAFISFAHEHRSRLIVVVLDDVVNNPDLDPEIRNYVRTHTYIRWDDPQFWEKLRYALPHREKIVKTKKLKPHADRNNEGNILLTTFVESNMFQESGVS